MSTSKLSYLLSKKGISFDSLFPCEKTIDYNSLTDEQLYKEIKKGHDDIKNHRAFSANEVNELFKNYFAK